MKSLNQFIHKGDPLDRLRLGARQLDALARKIRDVLPPVARDHVVGCALRPGLVVVMADSAAWAAQLRYLQQPVLAVCQKALGDAVQQVRFKVLPSEPVAGNPPAPELSKNTRRLLRGAASAIADDELAEALRRLSDSDQEAD